MTRPSVDDYDRENKIRSIEHLIVEAAVAWYLGDCLETGRLAALTRQLIAERDAHAAV